MVLLMSLVMIIITDYNSPALQCLMTPYVKAMETYCFIHSTFTLQNSSKSFGFYPGIEPSMGKEQLVNTQKYYFWMPYLIAFQALLFGLPCYCWHLWEGNFVQKLFGQDEDYIKRMRLTARYFVAKLNHNQSRALGFLVCEILGVASFVANIFLTDWYLEGCFIKAMPDILLNIFTLDKVDAKYDEIFPKVSKCTFPMFGKSGSIVKKDALCMMPRNLLAGRIYTLHFVMFWIALIIATLSLLLRIAEYLCPRFRLLLILRKIPSSEEKEDLTYVMEFSNVGDWLILYHFSRTMVNFKMWLKEVCSELRKEKNCLSISA